MRIVTLEDFEQLYGGRDGLIDLGEVTFQSKPERYPDSGCDVEESIEELIQRLEKGMIGKARVLGSNVLVCDEYETLLTITDSRGSLYFPVLASSALVASEYTRRARAHFVPLPLDDIGKTVAAQIILPEDVSTLERTFLLRESGPFSGARDYQIPVGVPKALENEVRLRDIARMDLHLELAAQAGSKDVDYFVVEAETVQSPKRRLPGRIMVSGTGYRIVGHKRGD